MKTFLFCLIVVGLVSCGDEKVTSFDGCVSDNISEGTPWFDTWIASMNCSCQQTVYKGKYESKTVFYSMLTDASCCWIFGVSLYDCNGKVVKVYNEDGSVDFSREVTLSEVVYTCEATR